jgi:Ca2+-binding RTX toxin-like protein
MVKTRGSGTLLGRSTGLALLALLAVAAPASATTINVNTTVDELNTDGDCALREATVAANTDAASDACPAGGPSDTINVPAGTYPLTIVGPEGSESDTFFANPAVGDLDFLEDVNVVGAGARRVIIEGGAGFNDRIIDVPATVNLSDPPELVPSDANVALSGLTVRNGEKSTIGGGIRNVGTLTLTDVAVRDNQAGFGGGGIRNDFDLTVNRSEISDNTTGAPPSTEAVGPAARRPKASRRAGVLGGDGPAGVGGGAGIFNNADARVVNSTISGNDSDTFGGGLTNFGVDASFEAENVTFAANGAPTGGNIANTPGPAIPSGVTAQGPPSSAFGTVTLNSTIVANPREDDNCAGPIESAGFNLEFPGTSCGLEIRGDPRLGPLANNGGPTNTHRLGAGSAAIDRVGRGACPPPGTDQRGVARPQGARCDVGAFEAPNTPAFAGDPCTVRRITNRGTSGNDDIVGTPGSDVIFGGSGNDRIDARGGNDIVCGESGNDRITGGDGNDAVDGATGNDRVDGASGNDRVFGFTGDDDLFGASGNDELFGEGGGDDLDGGQGSDRCAGGPGPNTKQNCER